MPSHRTGASSRLDGRPLGLALWRYREPRGPRRHGQLPQRPALRRLALEETAEERSLNGNQLVVRQGEEVQSVIFVRSGSLAMLKLVDGKEPGRPVLSNERRKMRSRRREAKQ